MHYITLLLITIDTALVIAGLKSSPDPRLVDKHGSWAIFSAAIRVGFACLVWLLASSGWRMASEIVELRAAAAAHKIKVGALLVERDYDRQALKTIKTRQLNEKTCTPIASKPRQKKPRPNTATPKKNKSTDTPPAPRQQAL